MNTKHTAGQWKITEVHNGYYSIGTGAVEYIDTKGQLKQGYRPIAFVGGNYCPVDEAEANAKLIAAAPELLESLDNLMASLSGLFYKDQEQTNLILAAKNRANEALKSATQ